MSPSGEAKRKYLLANKDIIRPRRCKHSETGWGIAKGVLECACIECPDCACEPWEE